MNEQKTILMVDDDEDAIILMRESFRQANCTHPLQEVHNGEEAIDYMKGEGPYSDRRRHPLPIAMLLDLNMPKMNGYGVLAWVRARPGLKHLPIIIMTASMRDEDVERAYYLGATAFLVKPGSLKELVTMARGLCNWIQINHFPPIHETRRDPEASAAIVKALCANLNLKKPLPAGILSGAPVEGPS
jgi:CheY-like chemotaxis protein